MNFVRASAAQVKSLAERRFDGMHFPVIMIDGVEYAGETMICPRPPEVPRRVRAAPVGGVPRDGLRGRQGVAGGDGALAGADQRGCGFEPAGGIGADADGGAAGRAGSAAADPGDDQPDRVGADRDAAGDGARDCAGVTATCARLVSQVVSWNN